ncbi:MAG: hypothetical protein MK180_16400 [Rhodobacteraceae bacterium]|nr:hypothetical protein [Paracoccaceae bacterium]
MARGIGAAGGICISQAAYDYVGQKIAADFTPLGPTRLKNIPAPVDVWRIEIDGVRVSPLQTGPKSAGFTDRIVDAVLGVAPPMAALVFAVLGIAVMLVSAVMGFGQYQYNLTIEGAVIAKEVGFIWSPGWTVTMVIILPLLITIGLHGMQEMVEIAKRMNKRCMVVDDNFRVVTSDYLEARTRRALRITLRVFAVLVLALGTFAIFRVSVRGRGSVPI